MLCANPLSFDTWRYDFSNVRNPTILAPGISNIVYSYFNSADLCRVSFVNSTFSVRATHSDRLSNFHVADIVFHHISAHPSFVLLQERGSSSGYQYYFEIFSHSGSSTLIRVPDVFQKRLPPLIVSDGNIFINKNFHFFILNIESARLSSLHIVPQIAMLTPWEVVVFDTETPPLARALKTFAVYKKSIWAGIDGWFWVIKPKGDYERICSYDNNPKTNGGWTDPFDMIAMNDHIFSLHKRYVDSSISLFINDARPDKKRKPLCIINNVSSITALKGFIQAVKPSVSNLLDSKKWYSCFF